MTHFRDTTFYRYHCDTKHTLARLYSHPHFLDWANQPNPFRHYDGAELIDLPVPERPAAREYFGLANATESASVTLSTVSQLLYYSMAISAWKEVPKRGLRWALRVNPSSGNLHPTETHLIARNVAGLEDGCYHFRVDGFQLEQRYAGPVDDVLRGLCGECAMAPRVLTVVLTSIFAREAWKYRARAFRYCHHDLGHAVGAIAEASRGLGLPCFCNHLFDDSVIEQALGLDGGDEVPGAVLSMGMEAEDLRSTGVNARCFQGTANVLTDAPIEYSAIEEVYRATAGRGGARDAPVSPPTCGDGVALSLQRSCDSRRDLWDVIRQRRSGVNFDGKTAISADEFGAILHRATAAAPGDVFHGPERRGFVRCYVYVHRVSGVDAGVYQYDRCEHRLVRVRAGDQRKAATRLSLGQRIAGDSAFAVSMIADFDGAYRSLGERGYRAMHLEAGFIGQGLYLGAETVGVNATGIGAFFDDKVNRYLGLGEGSEVIYHFTVGRAVEDVRLRTTAAYPFEQ